MTEPESVLSSMATATWSAEDGTAYEVALEGINHVVGAYSGLIDEAKTAHDTARAETLIAERRRWAARRESLTPARRTEVDVITAECSRLLAQLRGPA
ncbi:hypothetical protein [Streptomyces ipomoeae]|uniref:hypothetical protein n=1 Tax=Streptomyces ipomoeae TaxID=103232 RepID=UPI0029B69580|nr:hypothetical protein [Streptomyces ipomoeae]MDX2692188.1 hypothetical protein [Streptomyces ipomoeae]MDX2839295.1 hypothetical protein [Streptomyces ipomoeae]